MKTVVRLSLVITISLAIAAGILAVVNVRATLGSGYASVRIPEDEIPAADLNSITYMVFWHYEDAENMAINLKPEDKKYFSTPEKNEDGFYISIRTGSETQGNPFNKSRFYFQGYAVVATSGRLYLGQIERRGDSYMLHIKALKKTEANNALEGSRLLVTNRAFSSLREGTIRAKQPSPSA